MKEVKKCSISGLAFTMEDDAYLMLKDYLDSLKRRYGNTPDGGEIIADIEARIAELILSTQDNGRVVERPLIANIIAQLGTAEDISKESSSDDPTKTVHGEPRIPRRLYRDMENARLGGVCAGIAKYFGIEAVWVRLVCLSPLIVLLLHRIPFVGFWAGPLGGNLLGVVSLSYFIMWLAVPAARTARQKLEASGEKITVRSIRDMSADAASRDADSRAKPVIAETVTVFGRIITLLLKLFACLIIFALTLVALMEFLGLGVLLFAGDDILSQLDFPGSLMSDIFGLKWLAVTGVAAAFIPTVMLLYVLLGLVLGAKLNRWALLVMFVLWLAVLVTLPVSAVKWTAPHIHSGHWYSRTYADEHRRLQDSIEREAEKLVPAVLESEEARRVEFSTEYPSIDAD